jgi:hypothetical protein
MRVFSSIILFADRFFEPFPVNCLVNSTILTPVFVYSSIQILSKTFLIPGRIEPDILSLRVKWLIFFTTLSKLKCSRQIWMSPVYNFTKIVPVKTTLIHKDRGADWGTNVTKLIVAFRNYVNKLKYFFRIYFLVIEVLLHINSAYNTRSSAAGITIWQCVRHIQT